MTSATRRADSQKIRNQALHADTASPEPLITHPQPHRLNSYLASSSFFPKMTQGILVTPGYAGLQYFLTADGHIIALQVTPKP